MKRIIMNTLKNKHFPKKFVLKVKSDIEKASSPLSDYSKENLREDYESILNFLNKEKKDDDNLIYFDYLIKSDARSFDLESATKGFNCDIKLFIDLIDGKESLKDVHKGLHLGIPLTLISFLSERDIKLSDDNYKYAQLILINNDNNFDEDFLNGVDSENDLKMLYNEIKINYSLESDLFNDYKDEDLSDQERSIIFNCAVVSCEHKYNDSFNKKNRYYLIPIKDLPSRFLNSFKDLDKYERFVSSSNIISGSFLDMSINNYLNILVSDFDFKVKPLIDKLKPYNETFDSESFDVDDLIDLIDLSAIEFYNFADEVYINSEKNKCIKIYRTIPEKYSLLLCDFIEKIKGSDSVLTRLKEKCSKQSFKSIITNIENKIIPFVPVKRRSFQFKKISLRFSENKDLFMFNDKYLDSLIKLEYTCISYESIYKDDSVSDEYKEGIRLYLLKGLKNLNSDDLEEAIEVLKKDYAFYDIDEDFNESIEVIEKKNVIKDKVEVPTLDGVPF